MVGIIITVSFVNIMLPVRRPTSSISLILELRGLTLRSQVRVPLQRTLDDGTD